MNILLRAVLLSHTAITMPKQMDITLKILYDHNQKAFQYSTKRKLNNVELVDAPGAQLHTIYFKINFAI